jgi:hypothetical protein
VQPAEFCPKALGVGLALGFIYRFDETANVLAPCNNGFEYEVEIIAV